MTRAVPILRVLLDAKGESLRYLGASGLALAADFGTYSGLIRLFGVEVLVAAPIGFLLGLVAIYFLSVRWVFRTRRLSDTRTEFGVFAAIGLAGLALNQAVIYAGVQLFALVPEVAKLVSAATVFGFNFLSRKLLLFTRY